MIDDTPTPFYTYGERLAAIRDDHHMTLKAMGEAVGVSASTWSKYEKEESYPKKQTLLNLYSVFHVSEEWLEENEGPMYEGDYTPGKDALGEKVDYDEYLHGIALEAQAAIWTRGMNAKDAETVRAILYGNPSPQEIVEVLKKGIRRNRS